MKKNLMFLLLALCFCGSALRGQGAVGQNKQLSPPFSGNFPVYLSAMPLYDGAIPNSIPGPNREEEYSDVGRVAIRNVSIPTLTVYLAPQNRSAHSAVVLFPGGGYTMLAWEYDGTRMAQALVDHGITVVLVKYRLPSDATMVNKSIGPLQDAQQAIRVTRLHAAEWNLDPHAIGVMGSSAGGHLAATVGTHLSKDYIPNPDHINLRPDFMVLVFPVISMKIELTHLGSRRALLGDNPSKEQVELFSNELQVAGHTPPTLILHATDDSAVDVENSVVFYEALHRHQVAAEAILFASGDHGFFNIPRDEWMQPVFAWMARNGWMKP